ncbi:PAS domain-containing protein [Hymenobacter sp.]|uniref:PAS domain-containing protein n=1 Tax=Hymenobacter sp. TaxID=1898978 RepID=UPI00286BC29D|nr:PAS domain-containing protein [Hymenobacter sp.]
MPPAPSSPDLAPPDELLQAVLAVSLTAVQFWHPLYAAEGAELVDFALDYLNPAGQRLLGLPERPGGTLLRTRYPHTVATGIFEFYRGVFLSGEAGRYDVNYQADGLDNYHQLAAQRSGPLLVVSLTDTADHGRSTAEEALRASQAREQAARAEAEAQRQHLHEVLMQLPAQVATHRGPEHAFELVNPNYQHLFPTRVIQGRPVREALPELAGQRFFELLDHVYQTGEPFYGTEMETWADLTQTERLDRGYVNVFFQALHDAQGQVNGVLSFSYDVTEQVESRRQVQALNQQLATANKMLLAANAELRAQNTEQRHTQQRLQRLNHTLDARVAERTAALQRAQVEAQQQRADLQRVFEQAPVSIVILRGPGFMVELANDATAALWGRPAEQAVGRPLFEELPDLAGQGLEEIFETVRRTGEPAYPQELPVARERPDAAATGYYNLSCQPLRDAQGHTTGVIVVGVEVTEQVLARQHVQQLYEELTAFAEEQQATNEELEIRVAERTHAVRQAQAETERQRQRLERFFQQAPAAICVLDGPGLVFELVNPAYQQLFPSRALLGRPLLDALPEIVGPVYETFRTAYATGNAHAEQARLVPFARPEDGGLEDRYFTFLQQARFNEQYRIDGLLVCAFEVTAQVLAQQRAAALQAEVLAAAQRLAQERENFHQIFKNTPAAICIQRGPEHRYEYYNAAYQQFFPSRAMLGHPVAEALPETVEAGIVDLLDKVYQTGETYFGHELPLLVAQPDGRPPRQMYFTFTYQAYREDDVIVGISTFAYDVTAQVLARQQDEARQQQLYELFAQAPVAIAVLRGPRYVIELANPAVCALWGRSQAQALHTPLFELLPEVAGQGFEELLDGVLATGEPYVAYELPSLIDRNGRQDTVYWNFVYQPLRAADGQITGVTVVATEVSELLRARRELANQEQLRAVFEQAPVAVGVFSGPEYFVDVCNPGLQAIWGRTAAQALHRPLFEVLPEVRDQGFKALLDEVGRTGVPHVAREIPGQLLVDGQQVTVHLNFVYHPLRDDKGRITAIAAVATDVSEQVATRQHVQALNQQLAALNDKLYAANAALGEANDELGDANEALGDTNQQLTRTNVDLDTFVYTASHDLKAPINNIEGLLHTLLEELPLTSQVGDVAYVMGLMQGAVDRFKQTLGHLTDIAHLQQELGQPTAPVHPADVVRDVRLDLAPLIAETGAELDVDVADCPVLNFSEKNLRSVVYNLLSNALKYRHPDRPARVRLRCRTEALYWLLEVQDNGLGLDITPERPLFALFQRYHSHVPGSGVGLYMVKKMVENAGGKIEVQSQLGVGSTFTVYFKS